MSIDRQGTGLTLLRICLGVFFIAEGAGKWRWFADSTILGRQLAGWLQNAPAGSTAQWYLERIAIPGTTIFARLVPLGEIASGAALLVGFWTPVAAFVAFFMALNFHVASGAIARLSFLSNGYGLPVLGGTLALVFGGVRLRWSVRG